MPRMTENLELIGGYCSSFALLHTSSHS